MPLVAKKVGYTDGETHKDVYVDAINVNDKKDNTRKIKIAKVKLVRYKICYL